MGLATMLMCECLASWTTHTALRSTYISLQSVNTYLLIPLFEFSYWGVHLWSTLNLWLL